MGGIPVPALTHRALAIPPSVGSSFQTLPLPSQTFLSSLLVMRAINVRALRLFLVYFFKTPRCIAAKSSHFIQRPNGILRHNSIDFPMASKMDMRPKAESHLRTSERS